jgi:hypothetical protein
MERTSIPVLLLKCLLVRDLFDIRVPLFRLLQNAGDAADEIISNVSVCLLVVVLAKNPDQDRQHKLKVTT